MNTDDIQQKKIEQALFLPKEDAEKLLTPDQMERKERTMLCVVKRMDNPLITDKELVDFLMGGCGGNAKKVSQTQAYRDIAFTLSIVGNIKNASVAWTRYLVVEGAKKAYSIAETAKDAKGMAAALKIITEVTRANKNYEKFDFSAMEAPNWEVTDDVAVLGDTEKIKNPHKRAEELRQLFKYGNVKDAEIVE